MTRAQLSGSFQHQRMLIFGLITLAACTDSTRTVTSPTEISLAAAKAGGGNGPTVKSTDPDSATVDTTLNVTVSGSGFDVGSRADWAFKGVVSEKIVTNSTQFVSSSRLVANITIARNANIGSHDVIVTTSSGKGGIGTELFEVTVKPITNLGTLDGVGPTYANEINSAGTMIVGQHGPSSYAPVRGVRWILSNLSWTIEDLAPQLPGSTESVAAGLNDNGDVVGSMKFSGGDYHGFLLTASGQVTDLHDAPLCDGSVDAPRFRTGASDVNNRTELVGQTLPDDEANRALLGSSSYAFYWAGGCLTKLPALGAMSSAEAINDNGIIIGSSGDLSGNSPVRWARNADGVWAVTNLSLPSGCPNGLAVAVNKSGMAVGACKDTKTGKLLALRWSSSGASTVLPALERGDSRAMGINEAGDVAGWSIRKSGFARAVLWPVSGGIKDLGALVGSSQAFGLNDNNQVIGVGQVHGDGGSWPGRALLWTLP